MDTINRAGAFVVWIGLPITQRPDADAAVRHDQRDRREGGAEARPGEAVFIDTYTMFAGDDGGFAEYLPERLGRARSRCAPATASTSTRAGGDIIAREVLKELNAALRPDELAEEDRVGLIGHEPSQNASSWARLTAASSSPESG